MLILVGGALLLLVADSLSAPQAPAVVYALVTTVVTAAGAIAFAVPLWDRVQDPDEGAFSTLGQAVGVDGFSVFAHRHDRGGRHPRRAAVRRLAAPGGDRGRRALRAACSCPRRAA